MIDSSPRSSLTHTAYEQLRADVLAGRLQPGEKLKIADLCNALSVSLSAVREALSRLTSDGLVIASPQRGFSVAPVSADDLKHLTEARVQIESLCLKRAMALGGVAWESAIVAAFHRLSRTPERDPADPARMNNDWTTSHAAFHQALVGACDNTWLLKIRALLYAQSERYRHLSEAFSKEKRNVELEHREITDAVLSGDAERACELMAEHLRLTTRLLLNGRLATILEGGAQENAKSTTARRKRQRVNLQMT